MNQPIPFNPVAFNPAAPLQTLQNITVNLDQILEAFGAETTANAATIVGLRAFAEELKSVINNSSLPQFIKDAAISFIDGHVDSVESELAVPGDAIDAVADSEFGSEITETAVETATEAGESATAAATPAVSEEAATETAEETANESVGAAGGSPSQAQADAELNALMGDEGKKGRKNFLEVLAEAMGKTQGKFLQAALDSQNEMAGLQTDIENEKPGSAQAFTEAQSKFSAQMQMFNLYSNQVATSIKTIGEALSAIARKQ